MISRHSTTAKSETVSFGYKAVDRHGAESAPALVEVEVLGAAEPRDVDILVTNHNLQTNFVLFNDGAGAFAAAVATPDGSRTSTWGALGDIDDDGDLDAFIPNDGTNYLLRNLGGAQGRIAGTFQATALPGGTLNTRQIALGDIDRDGDLDAALAHPHQPFQLLTNQGFAQGGTEGNFTLSGQPLPTLPTHTVALGDLDGDGDLDAVTSGDEGQGTRLLVNQGGVQGGTEGVFTLAPTVYAGGSTRALALGDLDNDGNLDIVVGNDRNQHNLVLFNQGGLQSGTDGTFGSAATLPGGANGTFGVALGDVDADGDLDLMISNTQATSAGFQLLINQGGTVGAFLQTQTLLAGANGRSASFADLDGDDDLDVVLVNADQPNYVAFNTNGLGNFGPAQLLPGGNLHSQAALLGDLDGDGGQIVTAEGLPDLGALVPQPAATLLASSAALHLADVLDDAGAIDGLAPSGTTHADLATPPSGFTAGGGVDLASLVVDAPVVIV